MTFTIHVCLVSFMVKAIWVCFVKSSKFICYLSAILLYVCLVTCLWVLVACSLRTIFIVNVICFVFYKITPCYLENVLMGLPTHSPPEIQQIIDILKTNFRCRTSIYWNKRLDVIGTRFLWPDSLHEKFQITSIFTMAHYY